MLNMADDGVWCQGCKKFHPTLYWHEKYGVEQTQDFIIEKFHRDAVTRPGMFGFHKKNLSENEKSKIIDEIIQVNLRQRPIVDAKVGLCVVCGSTTMFKSKQTNRHVCSDECLYRENGWREEATGEAIVF